MENFKAQAEDIALRALKTFAQAAIAVLLVSGGRLDKTVLTAALAAGVSAVWNSWKAVRS